VERRVQQREGSVKPSKRGFEYQDRFTRKLNDQAERIARRGRGTGGKGSSRQIIDRRRETTPRALVEKEATRNERPDAGKGKKQGSFFKGGGKKLRREKGINKIAKAVSDIISNFSPPPKTPGRF